MYTSDIKEKLSKHQLKARFIDDIIMCYRYSKQEGSYDDEIGIYSFEFISEIHPLNEMFGADLTIWFKSGARKLIIFESSQLIDCLNFVCIISDFSFLTPLPIDYHKIDTDKIELFRIEEFLWQLKSSDISFMPILDRNSIKIGDDIILRGDIENKQFILNQEKDVELIYLFSGTIEETYKYLKSYFKLDKD